MQLVSRIRYVQTCAPTFLSSFLSTPTNFILRQILAFLLRSFTRLSSTYRSTHHSQSCILTCLFIVQKVLTGSMSRLLLLLLLALKHGGSMAETITCDPGYYTCGSGEKKKTSGRCLCPIMDKPTCHTYMTEVYEGRYTTVHTENTPLYAPGCYLYSGSSIWLNYMDDDANQVDCTERDVCICKKKSCDPCQTGKYGPGGVDPSCFSCRNGTYTDVIGQATCKHCSVGTYQDQNEGNKECKLCPAG